MADANLPKDRHQLFVLTLENKKNKNMNAQLILAN